MTVLLRSFYKNYSNLKMIILFRNCISNWISLCVHISGSLFSETYLKPSQTCTIELFNEHSYQLKAVNYFR